MKKKILFSAYTLDVGGVETALVNLLNNLINKYDITLVLEKKQGIFLTELDNRIKVLEYNPNQSKNVVIRKTINLFKRIKFILKYKNKFDFAASFATYSKMGSFCARTASKNNALWIHTNYIEFFNNNLEELVNFFNFINYSKFNKYIFVSKNSFDSIKNSLKKFVGKSEIIHNVIDYKKIIEKSLKEIEEKKENIVTFLNVARHDEQSKKISRLIYASKKLKEDNYTFKVLLIGEGKDTNFYKKIIAENKLEGEIKILGEKTNPYPYFKISDVIILTSDYEGYPVVFDEAKVLKLPIITTNVSDAKLDIENKLGMVVEKETESIYTAMKMFIEKKIEINKQINIEEYNLENLKKIELIINGGN